MTDTATATDTRPAVDPDRLLLKADNLVGGYLPGVNILNGCSIEVGEGELVGIIGPNGAGKSTLLKALFGQVKIHSGTVTLRGKDITGMRANKLVAQGVGFVPQNNNVFPSLTVEENMRMGVYLKPRTFAERWQFIGDLFPVLHDRRTQRAGAMSGGERQMVAMARALMMNPSVLLLDEPSAGLSPVRQDEAFLRTRMINKAGVSVIMVEQNARRCLQICDRAYVLDQGTDAYTGTGRELQADPKVISLYLGTLAEDVKEAGLANDLAEAEAEAEAVAAAEPVVPEGEATVTAAAEPEVDVLETEAVESEAAVPETEARPGDAETDGTPPR